MSSMAASASTTTEHALRYPALTPLPHGADGEGERDLPTRVDFRPARSTQG